jgi:hypothetical protein
MGEKYYVSGLFLAGKYGYSRFVALLISSQRRGETPPVYVYSLFLK